MPERTLLDGLRAKVPDASYALDELTGTQAYEWALNDVREALRSMHWRKSRDRRRLCCTRDASTARPTTSVTPTLSHAERPSSNACDVGRCLGDCTCESR